MAKSIIVPRLTDNDGPYRAAVSGDRVRVPRFAFTPFTVAGQPAGAAGGIGYCSNGDSGARVGCVHDGSIWHRLALGAEISLGVEIYALDNDGERFHVLTGDAAALTNPTNVVRPPGGVGGPSEFFGLWAVADGTTIWGGGAYWNPDINLANTFWRSVDSGPTWTNQVATHPDGKDGLVHSIFGIDGEIFACGYTFFGNARVLKWNSGTSVWDSVYTYAGAWQANCVWGDSPTNMYSLASTGTTLRLISNTGGAWGPESVSANSFSNVVGSGTPVALCGNSTGRLFVWVTAVAGGGYVYTGTFNGNDWVQDARVWDSGRQFPGPGLGRNIMQDETDAIWLAMFESATNDVEVYRRDPGTGLWSLAKDFNDAWLTGNGGSLWVVDSQCIIVGGAGLIGVYFEGAWTTYRTSLFPNWLSSAHPAGLWARRLG